MDKTLNAKDFLKRLEKLDKMISNKLIERDQWKSMAIKTTTNMESERVQSSGSKEQMADAVSRYMDIERELDECIDKLVDQKMAVIEVIEQLNAKEYDVLHKMYVQYLTLYDVADAYGKTYSWAASVHGRALKNVQRIMDKRNKQKKCNFLQNI